MISLMIVMLAVSTSARSVNTQWTELKEAGLNGAAPVVEFEGGELFSA